MLDTCSSAASAIDPASCISHGLCVRPPSRFHWWFQVGGMALVNGYIAEMATGEGKTLVATLAAYLHALEGRGVHIVTVNDYLANRDANG